MKDLGKKIAIIGQIVFYIFAAVTIFQIIKKLVGGSWASEEVIVSIIMMNLTTTLGIAGYLIHLNNKIAGGDKKLHGHIEWHKGRED